MYNSFYKSLCCLEVGGIGEETAACDWWSLGALLFELIVGKVRVVYLSTVILFSNSFLIADFKCAHYLYIKTTTC